MAKKQGISYSPNTALIQGAGVAYRNYDNMPGMYKGLDELTDAGIGMITQAGKDFEAEKKKKEEEAKAAEAEKAKQDKDWYDISGSVYENAGSFMKDVEYKDTVSQLTALKPRLIEAQKSGNPEEIAGVMTEFNNIKASVDDHKAFRETITNPEYGISDAMKHSGIVPGDNGEDHNFLTGLVKEDYTIVRKNNETYYNVGGVEKTMKEIKDMTILKDNIPYAAYSKAINDFSRAKNFDRDNTEYFVRNNVVPQETNKLRAFLADSGFGNGETFLQLLNKEGNRASIEQEIMNSVFNTNGGGIDDKEWENFTNAIVDPKNEFWKGDENAWKTESTRIATEQLTNGIENKWNNNQKLTDGKEVNPFGSPTKKDFNTKYGEWVSNAQRSRRREFVENNQGFNGLGGSYEYNEKNKTWTIDSGEGPKPINMYDILKDEALLLPGDKRIKSATDNEDNVEAGFVSEFSPKINMDFVKQDDNVVAEKLQEMMPPAFDVDKNPLGYKFMNLKDKYVKGMGDFTQEAVGLYSDDGKTLITYPKGHVKDVSGKGETPVVIQLGTDKTTRENAISTIDAILNTPEFKIKGFKSKLK